MPWTQHIFQKARVTSKRYKKQLDLLGFFHRISQKPLFSKPLKNLTAIWAQLATHSKGVTSYPENMAGLAKGLGLPSPESRGEKDVFKLNNYNTMDATHLSKGSSHLKKIQEATWSATTRTPILRTLEKSHGYPGPVCHTLQGGHFVPREHGRLG